MWLFNAQVVHLRRSYNFVVKIDTHPDTTVAGRKEGRVLRDVDALVHPLSKSTRAAVTVKFTDGKGAERLETLPIDTLVTTRLKAKGQHAIIGGDHIGKVVIHLKTDVDDVRVFVEGTDRKRDGFYVKKSELCVIEKNDS